jgi:hypothetical protein
VIIREPVSYDKEHGLKIPSTQDCFAVSGYAKFHDGFQKSGKPHCPWTHALVGDSNDDEKWVRYRAYLIVGPKWKSLKSVSPIVTVAGYTFSDSDEADASGAHIDGCSWDTVGLPEPETDLERIRLKVELRVAGGSSYVVSKLAYHLIAIGSL